MKYGESALDVLYLVFAISSGIIILSKAKSKRERYMGLAALILGCGDAFHLVPRVLNYFVKADFTVALGVGKLITSITMTVFYVLLCYFWQYNYRVKIERKTEIRIWTRAIIRCVLCLLPQNGWTTNSSDVLWGIIRNVPFVIHGAIVCYMFYTKREWDDIFEPMWIYILLSFVFYMPVAVGAGILPLLGMLMLPKTVCYILMIIAFLKSQKSNA